MPIDQTKQYSTNTPINHDFSHDKSHGYYTIYRRMKPIHLALILIAGIAFGAGTERPDITLNDGTVLKKAKILSSSPNDAVVLHSGGTVENIKWDQMPEEIRAKHGVSKESQEKFNKEHKKRVETNKKKSAVLQKIEDAYSSTIWVEFEVMQVIGDGILCKGTGYLAAVEKKRVSYSSHKKGSGLYPNEVVTNKHVEKYKTMPSFEMGNGEWVFIKCSTSGLYDGVKESFFVIPNGTYSYSTALTGASKTVESYMEASAILATYLSSEDLRLVSEREIKMAVDRGVAKRK